MQQNLYPDAYKEYNKIDIGNGLEIEIARGINLKARLYRAGVFIKLVDLSDKTAKRLFVVETVALGANQSKLAEAIGISRQTIHNYRAIQEQFGVEGMVISYHGSGSREEQRKINKEKIPRGNKVKQAGEIRRKKREEQEQKAAQLPLFTCDDAEDVISSNDQPFSELHNWLPSRYAGIFIYIICLISGSRWLEFIAGYFGNAYKIFMVFVLMVGRNTPSMEQLKNVHAREAGILLGLKKLPGKPKLWEWFYRAANVKKSQFLIYDYFRVQILAGAVGVWSWFIDGHLLPYTGKEKVHYSYNTRRRMPVPGQTNLVTCDARGKIVDFAIQEGKGNLREYIVDLKKRWDEHLPVTPLMVFDREGYGGDFFNELIANKIPFATWDKYVDTRALAKIDDEKFTEELVVNGKEYRLFEGTKQFTGTIDQAEGKGGEAGKKVTFSVRRIYIWNKSCNRRTCGLAWTEKTDVSTVDCARAILNGWGASENTFKHIKTRHPFHYHPGFKMEPSTKQEISNPEVKDASCRIKKLKNTLVKVFKKFAKTKDIFNKNGQVRKNSAKEKLKEKISALESEIVSEQQSKGKLPEKVDASTLENYRSFQQIDNEGKNLFDFVTSSVWNARKQMVCWLRQYYDQENDVVDLFYAITNCHGWVKSNATEVIVRLEPIQQPKRRAAQEQLCRKLTSLGARLPSGKWMVVEVGENPTSKVSKK